MSGLNLNKEECALLVALGWHQEKTHDGPEFTLDLGPRQVKMAPVLRRKLSPMAFRTQAERYDQDYSQVAQAIGWGGPKWFGPGQNALAMETFDVEVFDAAFAARITNILRDWALSGDPKQVVAEAIERRQKVRNRLQKRDVIDYAYLRRTEALEQLPIGDPGDGTEFFSDAEDPDILTRAIAVSKRP
jgi:hypothetical protein